MADATMTALVWPAGLERTVTPIPGRSRKRVNAALTDVLKAIGLLEDVTSLPASDIVLSFDQNARRGRAADGAVAAWFLWGDAQRCVTCDLYADLRDNLLAVAQLVRSCVAEHDRGSTAAVRHALESHMPRVAPLPPTPHDPPAHAPSSTWHILLGVSRDSPEPVITTAFRRLAHERHPDKGGDRQEWDQLLSSYRQARLDISARKTNSVKWVIAEPDDDVLWSNLFPTDDLDQIS